MSHFIQKKHLLAEIRQGDFTHPEDRKAVDFAISKIDFSAKQNILDVGSGLGGTVDMLNQQARTTGLDQDIKAIDYSRRQYPHCRFIHGDVADIRQLTQETYDLMTIFSAFYAFPDQHQACIELSGRARPKTDLLVFDYSSNSRFTKNLFHDDDSPFNPVALDRVEAIFSPWTIKQVDDVTDMFYGSYQNILNRMEASQSTLCHNHGQRAYDTVYDSFTRLMTNFDAGTLGGCLVHAQIE
ncbi:trans-aconitate 2-methyltransferase [Vibrio aerogenes CECT 7868]|uniref:Trans-aconitate 2-methyltransferase n=1 Tax=Vibrio aerogenes CECT 7868 TaxID=1216006 RepID=A0A1M6AEG6_9VIBR|nr:class I SAM-dependent methyltransferase [Vibrio aerogenes]SHI34944.1 trans-aconitate 2-methyltransferase [Vibrio aerogenes CECT 7868]